MSDYVIEDLKPGYKGSFVIQLHRARRAGDHFDLRLEFPVSSVAESLKDYSGKRKFDKTSEPAPKAHGNTVLRSWAVPKHKVPTDKPILATETEDHELSYGGWSGTIPEGEYGAGKVEIFAMGTFELLAADYDKKYVFKLKSKKVSGIYSLFKLRGKQFLWGKVKNVDKYKMARQVVSNWHNRLNKIGSKKKMTLEFESSFETHRELVSDLKELYDAIDESWPLNWDPSQIDYIKSHVDKAVVKRLNGERKSREIIVKGALQPFPAKMLTFRFDSSFETRKELLDDLKELYEDIKGMDPAGWEIDQIDKLKTRVNKSSGRTTQAISVEDRKRCTASAIDYVRPTLNGKLWDLSKDPPSLLPMARKAILRAFHDSLGNVSWVKGLYISGSSTGYNYKEDGDLDIDVIYDPSKVKNPVQIQKALDGNRAKEVDGTGLTYSFMLLNPTDSPEADGIYDVLQNKWIKGPFKIPEGFDPDRAFVKERAVADSVVRAIYTMFADVKMALRDLGRIDQYDKLHDKLSQRRIMEIAKIKRLCMDLYNTRAVIWKLHEDSKNTESPIFPAFNFSRNWDRRYIIFKYIARYGMHEPVKRLYEMLEGEDYLPMVKKFMPADATGRF